MPKNNKTEWPEEGEGYLEISDKGFGFLRSPGNRFQSKPSDVFVTPDTIRRHYLREGCFVKGRLVPPHTKDDANYTVERAVKSNARFAAHARKEWKARAPKRLAQFPQLQVEDGAMPTRAIGETLAPCCVLLEQ